MRSEQWLCVALLPARLAPSVNQNSIVPVESRAPRCLRHAAHARPRVQDAEHEKLRCDALKWELARLAAYKVA
jgi:hypothetical protein